MNWKKYLKSYKYGIAILAVLAIITLAVFTITFIPTLLPDEPQPPEQNSVNFYLEQQETAKITFLPKYQHEIESEDHYIQSITITDDNETILDEHTDLTHSEQPEELQEYTREDIEQMSEQELQALDELEDQAQTNHITELHLEDYYNQETDEPHTLTVTFTYQNGATHQTEFELRHPRELINTIIQPRSNNDGTITLTSDIRENSFTQSITVNNDDGETLTTLTPNTPQTTLSFDELYEDTTGDGIYDNQTQLHATGHSQDQILSSDTQTYDIPHESPRPSITHNGDNIEISATFNDSTNYYIYTPDGNYLEHPDTGETTQTYNLPPESSPRINLTQNNTTVYLLTEYNNTKYLVTKHNP